MAGESAATLFKRGSKADVIKQASAETKGNDEEKGKGSAPASLKTQEDAQAALKEAVADTPKMHDIFTWQHLYYTIPIGHRKTRQLLDDVSGYVAPGKLTALVGESGAGKVR